MSKGSSQQQSRIKVKKLLALKIGLVIFCLVGFALNSYATIKQFLYSEKVVTQIYSTSTGLKGVHFPSITLCPDLGLFEMSDELTNFTLEEVDSISWHLEDFLVRIDPPESLQRLSLSPEELYDVKTLYTNINGKCYSFTLKQFVSCFFSLLSLYGCSELFIS